jgi:hypothetical protein
MSDTWKKEEVHMVQGRVCAVLMLNSNTLPSVCHVLAGRCIPWWPHLHALPLQGGWRLRPGM